MSQCYLPLSLNCLRESRKGDPGASKASSTAKAGLNGLNSHVQVLALNNERFMVPEVLFQPSDIGLQQGGLAQTIVEAVEATHPDLHPLLYSNLVCTGGCATCPGFQQRLYSELRALVPDDYEVRSCIILSPLLRGLRVCSAFLGAPLLQAQGACPWAAMRYEARLCQVHAGAMKRVWPRGSAVSSLAEASLCWGQGICAR